MGADTKANALGAAAHFRLVIFIPLRTAASAVAPLVPILLSPRLRARAEVGAEREREGVSRGTRRKTDTWEAVQGCKQEGHE